MKIDELTDDIFTHLVPYVGGGPASLVKLGLTSKFFGGRREDGGVSFVEQIAAKLMEKMRITEEERACIPKRDGGSLIGVYNNFLKLREPLEIDQVIGDDVYHKGLVRGAVQSSVNDGAQYAKNGAAFSNYVMRAGKHYVTFHRCGGVDLFGGQLHFGVIRPSDFEKKGFEQFEPWEEKNYPLFAKEKSSAWGDGQVDYCVYHQSGNCYFGYWTNPDPKEEEETIREWPGKTHFPPCTFGEGEDPAMGMLLDLDGGTLSVYKNGKRLGVMKDGLTGEYVWFVMVRAAGVRMAREAIPPQMND